MCTDLNQATNDLANTNELWNNKKLAHKLNKNIYTSILIEIVEDDIKSWVEDKRLIFTTYCWYQMVGDIRFVVCAHHHRLTSEHRTGLTIFSCSCYNVNRNYKLSKNWKTVLVVEDITG